MLPFGGGGEFQWSRYGLISLRVQLDHVGVLLYDVPNLGVLAVYRAPCFDGVYFVC